MLDFLVNFFAPRTPESSPEWIAAILIALVLAFLVRYALAMFLVRFRTIRNPDGVWNGSEVILDAKVWAGLLACLLWMAVIGYCLLIPTFDVLLSFVPYVVALLITMVLTAVSLYRLNASIRPYRNAVRA